MSSLGSSPRFVSYSLNVVRRVTESSKINSASAVPSTREEKLTFLCAAPATGATVAGGGNRTHRRSDGHDFAKEAEDLADAAADQPRPCPLEWSRNDRRTGHRLGDGQRGNQTTCDQCLEFDRCHPPGVPEDHGLAEGVQEGGPEASIRDDP